MNPTLINQTPVEVTLADGSKETVGLRQLTIRQLYTFTEHLRGEQMTSLVCLCVDKPEEWIDTLTLESYTDLVQKCLDANFPKAATLAQRDPIVATKIAPLIYRMQGAERMMKTHGEFTNSPSPTPAASASAAATGKGASTSRRRG